MPVKNLAQLARCQSCKRLAAHHLSVAEQYPEYHAAPVGSWGDRRSRLLIVGLAPGLHGATRTGKAFVGDDSGNFLFNALHRNGFASSAMPSHARLLNASITNAVKCLPPGNAPKGEEVRNCAPYLEQELAEFHQSTMRKPRVVLALGSVAFRALCRQYQIGGQTFVHAAHAQLAPSLHLVASFHPSRLNVNTGRINASMMDDLFAKVRKLL